MVWKWFEKGPGLGLLLKNMFTHGGIFVLSSFSRRKFSRTHSLQIRSLTRCLGGAIQLRHASDHCVLIFVDRKSKYLDVALPAMSGEHNVVCFRLRLTRLGVDLVCAQRNMAIYLWMRGDRWRAAVAIP